MKLLFLLYFFSYVFVVCNTQSLPILEGECGVIENYRTISQVNLDGLTANPIAPENCTFDFEKGYPYMESMHSQNKCYLIQDGKCYMYNAYALLPELPESNSPVETDGRENYNHCYYGLGLMSFYIDLDTLESKMHAYHNVWLGNKYEEEEGERYNLNRYRYSGIVLHSNVYVGDSTIIASGAYFDSDADGAYTFITYCPGTPSIPNDLTNCQTTGHLAFERPDGYHSDWFSYNAKSVYSKKRNYYFTQSRERLFAYDLSSSVPFDEYVYPFADPDGDFEFMDLYLFDEEDVLVNIDYNGISIYNITNFPSNLTTIEQTLFGVSINRSNQNIEDPYTFYLSQTDSKLGSVRLFPNNLTIHYIILDASATIDDDAAFDDTYYFAPTIQGGDNNQNLFVPMYFDYLFIDGMSNFCLNSAETNAILNPVFNSSTIFESDFNTTFDNMALQRIYNFPTYDNSITVSYYSNLIMVGAIDYTGCSNDGGLCNIDNFLREVSDSINCTLPFNVSPDGCILGGLLDRNDKCTIGILKSVGSQCIITGSDVGQCNAGGVCIKSDPIFQNVAVQESGKIPSRFIDVEEIDRYDDTLLIILFSSIFGAIFVFIIIFFFVDQFK